MLNELDIPKSKSEIMSKQKCPLSVNVKKSLIKSYQSDAVNELNIQKYYTPQVGHININNISLTFGQDNNSSRKNNSNIENQYLIILDKSSDFATFSFRFEDKSKSKTKKNTNKVEEIIMPQEDLLNNEKLKTKINLNDTIEYDSTEIPKFSKIDKEGKFYHTRYIYKEQRYSMSSTKVREKQSHSSMTDVKTKLSHREQELLDKEDPQQIKQSKKKYTKSLPKVKLIVESKYKNKRLSVVKETSSKLEQTLKPKKKVNSNFN